MNTKTETAAEVLAEMLASAKEENHLSYSEVARFADRIERALSAQGEAVGEIVALGDVSTAQRGWVGQDVRWLCESPPAIGTKLYTHHAPRVEVDEAKLEREDIEREMQQPMSAPRGG